MNERRWPVVVGASRELLELLKSNQGSVPEYDQKQPIEVGIFSSALGSRMGNLAGLVLHEFRKDPRQEVFTQVACSRVGGVLFTIYAERPDLRIAALNLWQFYVKVIVPVFNLGRDPISHATEESGELLISFEWPKPISGDERQNRLAKFTQLPQAQLAQFEQAIEQLALATAPSNSGKYEYYVTIQQMAGVVSRSTRTIERLLEKNRLPLPDVNGGGGKPNEWRWSVVRPVLSKEFCRELPEIFPADTISRTSAS